MAEFIFMLTHHDATVPNALDVYETLRGSGLRHVGFKDVGASLDMAVALVDRIHADGRTAYLEVVSISPEAELRSLAFARDVGVDIVMGGTHVGAALELLAGSGPRYFPFPGRVTGHPSVLEGTVEEIVASAMAAAARPGVAGLDLLAYRHAGDPETVAAGVVRATSLPVVIAGSVASERQIEAVSRCGAWAFTIGGAVFDATLPAGPSILEQVDWALRTAASYDASGGADGMSSPT